MSLSNQEGNLLVFFGVNMKTLFFLTFTSILMLACTREDHAGTVGSGAGIEEEQDLNRSDASEDEDMNITTPIYKEEEEVKD